MQFPSAKCSPLYQKKSNMLIIMDKKLSQNFTQRILSKTDLIKIIFIVLPAGYAGSHEWCMHVVRASWLHFKWSLFWLFSHFSLLLKIFPPKHCWSRISFSIFSGFVPHYQERPFLVLMTHIRGKVHGKWKSLKLYLHLSKKEGREEEHSGISHLKSIFYLGCKH